MWTCNTGPYADFRKGGCELKGFYKGRATLQKVRGANSVSGEKLHDFEMICPATGVRSPPPPTPAAYGPEISEIY